MIAATLIEVPAWGSFTLIEAAWLASGLMALVFSAVHISPLYTDWRFAVESKRLGLRATAAGYLRREIVRFLQGFCIAAVGLYAAVQPSALPGPAVVSATGLAITGSLLLVAALVTVQSAWDWHTREEVQRHLDYDVPTENAILLVNAAGKITYANGVADKVFGRRLVGLDVEELVPERLRATHRQHRAEYEKNPTTRPMGIDLGTVGLRSDGSEFPIYATLSPFTDETGESRTLMTVKLGDLPPTPN